MKNRVNYSSLSINTVIITAIITFAAIEFFLKSNLVVIHGGTTEGGLISAIGVLLIIVIASTISIATMLLIKKYQKKNAK